jgi:hypothetical protein
VLRRVPEGEAPASGAQMLVPLNIATAALRDRHRELLAAASQWAISAGDALDPDRLAVILGAVEDGVARVTPYYWTVNGANNLLTFDVVGWCASQRVAPVDGIPRTLWRYFDFLAATGRFDPRSDALDLLRRTLHVRSDFEDEGEPMASA